MDLETKARLLSVGTIDLERPVGTGPTSTAGPGAGGSSVFFRSRGRTVRLSVVPGSQLQLKMIDGGAVIYSGKSEIARGELVEPLSHCPDQAYITVAESCIYNCKFCAVPKMRGASKSAARVEEIVAAAAATGRLKAISITSGVEISPEKEVERIGGIVSRLRSFGVPIGVSVCPTKDSNELLSRAGAVEVKYNLETVDTDIFRDVCPGLFIDDIKDALRDAVEVFGRNRVFSNVIMGLGESDSVMRDGIDELCEMGVLPVIRAVYPHPLRTSELQMTRPTAQRLLDMARYTRSALDRHGLRGDACLTGCYLCTGCDLVPHIDL